eukprot:3974501-Amphidinium_carterae.1
MECTVPPNEHYAIEFSKSQVESLQRLPSLTKVKSCRASFLKLKLLVILHVLSLGQDSRTLGRILAEVGSWTRQKGLKVGCALPGKKRHRGASRLAIRPKMPLGNPLGPPNSVFKVWSSAA